MTPTSTALALALGASLMGLACISSRAARGAPRAGADAEPASQSCVTFQVGGMQKAKSGAT